MRTYKSTSRRTGITYKSIYPFDVNKNEDFVQVALFILGLITVIGFILNYFGITK